jgi:hypothetical protein
MRKIEQQMLNAIDNLSVGKSWQLGNTVVRRIEGKSMIFLHDNLIAEFCHYLEKPTNEWHKLPDPLVVNREVLRRYPTPTTKSRLRALGANVSTRKGVTYLNNVAI